MPSVEKYLQQNQIVFEFNLIGFEGKFKLVTALNPDQDFIFSDPPIITFGL